MKGRGSGLPWLAEGDGDDDKVETERKAKEAAYLGSEGDEDDDKAPSV